MNSMLPCILCLFLLAAAAAPTAQRPTTTPDAARTRPSAALQVPGFQTRVIDGWTVHVNLELLKRQPTLTAKALELLDAQLKQIVRVVPPEPVRRLRNVVLWIDPQYPGIPPRAEYHPGAGWLRDHGRNPAMAKGIEFTNVLIFQAECRRMPCFVLHELAHAYHDQVLGFDQPEIIEAYHKAVAGKRYDAVERWHGDGRPNTIERAYAMTNYKEYFAESTEAFFGRNDFFPFTRGQLHKIDPGMFDLLGRLWRVQAR